MQGADGHIYKGRMGTKLEARLPSVTQVTEGETTRFWFRVFLVFSCAYDFKEGSHQFPKHCSQSFEKMQAAL